MAGTKILIVEDDGTIVVRLQRLLSAWGYGVLTVGSGEEALQQAQKDRPDVALMDIRLDEDDGMMDGIEAAHQLRTRFDIPSIYLTAHADKEFLQRARATEPYGYLVKPLQDLSLRSTLDMAVAKIQVDTQLKALLNERDVLIREIHHRVKNNMSAITSLLSLMENRIQDAQALSVLQEGRDRICVMATVHQMLYKTDDLTHINIREYVSEIVYHLLYSYGSSPDKIAPIIEIEDIAFEIDVAVPCGLLINELVSNSLKYAFPGDRTGSITVALRACEDDSHQTGGGYELIVSDTGIGLPKDFDIKQVDSLGMILVTAWAQQLLGQLIIEPPEQADSQGVCFRIPFKRGL